MDKILIVDEEKWYMEAIFDRINADFGRNLYDYSFNGSDAIELLNKNKYSVIILDLMLPLGDNLSVPDNEPDLMYGILILRKIREINKVIPVICFTVLNDSNIKEEIKKLNALHIGKLDEDSYDRLFRELKKLIK
jgi:CheY-like chemotaxis protein